MNNARPLHLILATLMFPLPILVIIPIVLVSKYGLEIPAIGYWGLWLAKPLLPLGFSVAGYCVTLFFIEGKGTPAPWSPPTKFIVTGPYRYVRNPMNLGVILIVCGQGLLFAAPAFAVYVAALFVFYSALYIFIEEPALERRFGEEYREYKANVGRWIPRFPGWDAPWLPVEGEEEDKKDDNTAIPDSSADKSE